MRTQAGGFAALANKDTLAAADMRACANQLMQQLKGGSTTSYAMPQGSQPEDPVLEDDALANRRTRMLAVLRTAVARQSAHMRKSRLALMTAARDKELARLSQLHRWSRAQ